MSPEVREVVETVAYLVLLAVLLYPILYWLQRSNYKTRTGNGRTKR